MFPDDEDCVGWTEHNERSHQKKDRLIASATSFRLGCDGDHDLRDYVTVHRMYGVDAREMWQAARIRRGTLGGVDLSTCVSFADQSTALEHGLKMLEAIRAE